MYENMSYEIILERMLDRIPNTLDKRESSPIYNGIAPAAMELMGIYLELELIIQETFGDTASREYLIRRAKERGVEPYPATKALLKGMFTPSTINIPIGSRFSLNDLNYIVQSKTLDGEYNLECEETGVKGNQHSGDLIPVEYVEGLETAKITELLIPGEDEEDTEDFRKRYFNSLDSQAFGGNRSDYITKVNGVPGVGGTKIYRAWNGGGTVKLVIVNSQYKKPSTELIQQVQEIMDPLELQGEGFGLSPMNHITTIFGVDETIINITTNITYQSDYVWGDVKVNVEKTIDEYFLELNKTWADSENLIVRISQIETRLLNIIGILDVANTKINTLAENLILDVNSIALRGDVIG